MSTPRRSPSPNIHTYFNISHVDNVTITGYDGVRYIDKVGGANRPARQVGDIVINSEIDAVFQDNPGPSDILDSGFKRRITIAKEGSNSAVVWNPWIEKAKKLSGYTPEAYQTMVCVETYNILNRDYPARSCSRLKAISRQPGLNLFPLNHNGA